MPTEHTSLLKPSTSSCLVDVETPLPKVPMTLLLISLLADSLSITVVYPLAPYMVQDFFHFDTQQQSHIGYYAGVLAGAYLVGELLASPFWGYLSDRMGRRPVILIGMISNVICLVLFGCSHSYRMALIMRFTHGMASGNVPVIKAYVADITDRTNETRAFAYVAVVFGLGICIGPSLGGLLSHPAVKYPSLVTSTSLFGIYPYLLPVFVIAVKIGLDFILSIFYLPESTRSATTPPPQGPLSQGKERPLLHQTPSSGWSSISNCPIFRQICQYQLIVGLSAFGFWEVLPVWARGSSQMGGLEFLPSDIGPLQSTAGVFILICSLCLYSKLCSRYGCVRVYRTGIFLFLFTAPVPIVLTSCHFTKSNSITWILLEMSMMCYALGLNLCFTTFGLMIKASVPQDSIGFGMSVGNSIANLGCGFGPIVGGAVFASFSSLETILPSPLTYGRLYFFILILIVSLTYRQSRHLPDWPWTAPKRKNTDISDHGVSVSAAIASSVP